MTVVYVAAIAASYISHLRYAAARDVLLTSAQPRWDDQRKKASGRGAAMKSLNRFFGAAIIVSMMALAASAHAQDVKHYRFAYDQPKTTGYGILGDIFA